MAGIQVTTSDGVKLHVESAGSGPPVVLVSGYTVSSKMWAFQIEALTGAGYRAVAIDRRWHGLSDRPAHGHRIARHAADIRDVIECLHLVEPVLVGASMGASVCWSYLDLFGCGEVAGMVGIDQTPRMINGDDWGYGYYGLDKNNVGSFFDEGIPDTGKGRLAAETAPAFQRLIDKIGDAMLSDPPSGDTLALLNDHARQDWRDICATASCPMLLVAGRDSQLWPCEHANAAALSNPNCEATVIDECGHALPIEQPDKFNTRLLNFLNRVRPVR